MHLSADCRLQCGYLSMPNAVMHSVTWTDMNMLELGEDLNPPSHYEFNFTASQSSWSYLLWIIPKRFYLLQLQSQSVLLVIFVVDYTEAFLPPSGRPSMAEWLGNRICD